MTVQPAIDPWAHSQPWAPAEFMRLREETERRLELVEGALLIVPSPDLLHQRMSRGLLVTLLDSLPVGSDVVAELDVRLGNDFRMPDLVVFDRSAVAPDAKHLLPAQVRLAVEIVSPSSQRRDYLAKMHDYAQAGIPHYWIVDRRDGVTVTCYRNTPSHTYMQYATATGAEALAVSEPFEFVVTPESLTR